MGEGGGVCLVVFLFFPPVQGDHSTKDTMETKANGWLFGFFGYLFVCFLKHRRSRAPFPTIPSYSPSVIPWNMSGNKHSKNMNR